MPGATTSPRASPSLVPKTASISSRAMAPGRSSAGVSPRKETIVNSSPACARPPSRMRSMRPARSSATCAAVTGLTWPEILAEGAASGPPKARSSANAAGCDGMRSATLARPARASSQTEPARRRGRDERQRPRPKGLREPKRRRAKPRLAPRRRKIGDMGDQRIEARAALGGVNFGDRARRGGVGAKAVDGLGRKGDESPARKISTARASEASSTPSSGVACGSLI